MKLVYIIIGVLLGLFLMTEIMDNTFVTYENQKFENKVDITTY